MNYLSMEPPVDTRDVQERTGWLGGKSNHPNNWKDNGQLGKTVGAGKIAGLI